MSTRGATRRRQGASGRGVGPSVLPRGRPGASEMERGSAEAVVSAV